MFARTAVALALTISLAVPASALDSGDVHVRGLLDLSAAGGEGVPLNRFNVGDSNFDPYRLRLFLDANLGGGFEAHVQTIAIGQEHALLQYGAYALWTPLDGRDLHLEGGQIPWPIGTWAPRTYSNKNPLIGTPMLYQLHGTLSFAELPPSTDALLAVAGRGESGVDYGSGTGSRGVPIAYDRCWDVGVIALGAITPVEFALGFVQGAPSWPQPGSDESPGKTLLGRIGIVAGPSIRVGFSAAHGPWLPRTIAPALRPGVDLARMTQSVAIADLEYQRARVEWRAEAYLNEWRTPYVGRLDVRGAWSEMRVGVGAGAWIAARGEVMTHSRLTSSLGARQTWDHDRGRFESGVGCKLTRSAIAKVAWQRNVERIPGSSVRNADVTAATLSLSF